MEINKTNNMSTTKGTLYENSDGDMKLPIFQDGVKFEVTNPEDYHKLTDKPAVKNSISTNASNDYLPSVNAVDIDWNGAKFNVA